MLLSSENLNDSGVRSALVRHFFLVPAHPIRRVYEVFPLFCRFPIVARLLPSRVARGSTKKTRRKPHVKGAVVRLALSLSRLQLILGQLAKR
jgi:hypothetical protein